MPSSLSPSLAPDAFPDTLRAPDPLIRALRDAIARKASTDGRLRADDSSLPDVSVHKVSVSRALRVLDAVVKGGRKLGFEFQAHDRYRKRSLHIVVDGEPVQFGLKEKYRQERVPPQRGAPEWERGSVVYHSTGRLSLGLGHNHSTAFRRLLGDTDRVRVEDRVGEFLVGVHDEALRQREERELVRQAQADRERAAEAARALAREQATEAEHGRVLQAQADDWDRSRRIAAFVDEVERRAATVVVSAEEGMVLAEWVRWARERASLLDPLARGLPPWPDRE